MSSQYVSSDEYYKWQVCDDEQLVRYFNTNQLKRHIIVPFNLSANATNTDDRNFAELNYGIPGKIWIQSGI